MAIDPSDGAGPFGSIAHCDIPVSVLDKMRDKIIELQPDLLFWTGDAVPHDGWNYSLDHVKKYQSFLFNYMVENFSEFQIYPLEGNHDFGEVMNS